MPHDLVNQVPFEILSRIFALYLPGIILIRVENVQKVPAEVLARVCSRWRSILLRESRYWINVEVDFTGLTSSLVNDALLACASRCFSRAGEHLPLSLSLCHLWNRPSWYPVDTTENKLDSSDKGSKKIPPHSVHDFLLSVAHRLETLDLLVYFSLLEIFLGPSVKVDDDDVPQPPPFLILKTLDLRIVADEDQRLIFSSSIDYLPECPILFSSDTPNLHHLTISYIEIFEDFFDNTYKFRPLPVRVFSVPWEQLTYLDLIGVEMKCNDFHEVLQMCARLTSLAITPYREDSEADEAVEATSLPLLTTLTLDLTPEARQDGFLYIRDFSFPVLENLTFKGFASNVWPIHARDLLRKSPIKRIFLSLKGEKGVEHLFKYVPQLTHFESDLPLTEPSFDRLRDSGLVPHLERFTCSLRAELLGNFIDMLEARLAAGSGILSGEILCFLTNDSRHGSVDERNAKLDRLHREACERLATFGEKAKSIIITIDV